MQNYKDMSGNIHFLSIEDIENVGESLLPVGCEKITQQEADLLRLNLNDSGPAPTITPLQFIERFTNAEQLAVVTAAMQAPALRLWYDKLMAAQVVVLDDERLVAGMNSLVQEGLVTQARHDEIMS